jgi:GTP-binding protein LepA
MGRNAQKEAIDIALNLHGINGVHPLSASGRHEKNEKQSSSPSSPSAGEKELIEMLDTLSVERERGITVKASTATMLYPHPSAVGPEGVLLINCIDCPGHSDFSSEVARSLNFVQGAVLLLDATQGIQVRLNKSLSSDIETLLAVE